MDPVAGARAGLDEVASARLPSLFGSGNVVGFQEPMLVAPLHTFDPDELRADPREHVEHARAQPRRGEAPVRRGAKT